MPYPSTFPQSVLFLIALNEFHNPETLSQVTCPAKVSPISLHPYSSKSQEGHSLHKFLLQPLRHSPQFLKVVMCRRPLEDQLSSISKRKVKGFGGQSRIFNCFTIAKSDLQLIKMEFLNKDTKPLSAIFIF